MSKLSQIEQKIRELVPSLQELSFGCEYRVRKGGMRHKLRKEYMEKSYCGECREGTLAGQAFRDYRCGYCKKSKMHPNTATPKYCEECAEKHEVCRYCACPVIILGHPIQLHHVLQAIGKVNGINPNMELHSTQLDLSKDKYSIDNVLWDLTKPLSGQSEEVVKFLNGVLN